MIETQEITISRPCNETWESMDGSAKVRYCYKCKKSVYNLTGLSDEERLAFVSRIEGVPVASLFRRGDGKYMIGHAPKPFFAGKARLAVAFSSALVVVLMLAGDVDRTLKIDPEPAAVQSEKVSPASEPFKVHGRDGDTGGYSPVEVSLLERVRRSEKWIAFQKHLVRERDRFIG